MSVRIALLLLALWPLTAGAQGFANLGTEAEGYALPDPDHVWDFPADHGPHPDFRIEWWYLTASLQGDDGHRYGVQWTLFRLALTPQSPEGWGAEQIWMGHAGLTAEDSHHSAERFARGGIGQAGVTAQPFEAWIDDWRMAGQGTDTGDALDALTLTSRGPDFAYDLDLEATGPLVFHGQNGYSVKSEAGQASNYYSQPFYEVSGTLMLPGGEVAVTGQGWLDREWSSQPLTDSQTGWDWISLQFDDGARLMGYRLRDASGPAYTVGTWIEADGTTQALSPGDLIMTPLTETEVAGRSLPTEWQVDLAGRDLSLRVGAINPQSWQDVGFAYWEGPVTVSGTRQGVGYLEMTGYD
ncbi:iron ABC transporter permease [Rhodobacterales bacterium HKCCE3408]|nr:iron ABC transporter permease [Rhodobacterales bacterium HKCCE3408]